MPTCVPLVCRALLEAGADPKAKDNDGVLHTHAHMHMHTHMHTRWWAWAVLLAAGAVAAFGEGAFDVMVEVMVVESG